MRGYIRDRDTSNQIFWAVYDTETDSDFYSFNTLEDAKAEVTRWLDDRLDYELRHTEGANWGRFYICSALADTVPDDDTAGEWSLWNYGGEGYPVLTYREVMESWGECAHYDMNPERFTA